MGSSEKQPAHLDVQPSKSAASTTDDDTPSTRPPSMSVAARSRQKQSPPGAIPAGRHNQVPPLGILARVGPPDALASSGLRPLLPAAAGPRAPGINPTPLLPRKRSAVLVACSACQKARTKVSLPLASRSRAAALIGLVDSSLFLTVHR